jgi:catechol 2,3-dioxygenase-like lactoylglutathione lyase family enzyme
VDSWNGGIAAVTLFVEDLDAAKRFYRDVLDLSIHFEDDASAVFRFGETLINLLQIDAAHELIAPARVAERESGSRIQFTLQVEDVDAACEELERRGAKLLNGPMDRPWGIRTASFQDPAGHIWEVAASG